MRSRTLGRSGINVSEVGLGAWALGGTAYGEVTDDQAAGILEAYFEEGGNFIDTARGYDRSERRIGDALRRYGNRDEIVLASKTGATKSFEDVQSIRKDLDATLADLGTSYLDIYYLHSPPEDAGVMDAVLREFEALKGEGKIRCIGASIKGPNVTRETTDLCTKYVDSGRIDVVQLIFSIFRQLNREVIKYACTKNIGVVSRTSIESGFLSGKYNPEAPEMTGRHRKRWSGKQQKKLLSASLGLHDWAVQPPYHSLAQVALGYALAAEGVTSVIAGAKNRYQTIDNTEVGELPPIDPGILTRLDRDFRDFTNAANVVQ